MKPGRGKGSTDRSDPLYSGDGRPRAARSSRDVAARSVQDSMVQAFQWIPVRPVVTPSPSNGHRLRTAAAGEPGPSLRPPSDEHRTGCKRPLARHASQPAPLAPATIQPAGGDLELARAGPARGGHVTVCVVRPREALSEGTGPGGRRPRGTGETGLWRRETGDRRPETDVTVSSATGSSSAGVARIWGCFLRGMAVRHCVSCSQRGIRFESYEVRLWTRSGTSPF